MRLRLKQMPTTLLADLRRLDELWQDGLQRFGGPFLAGPEFSAVDAFYAPVAFRVQTYSLPLSAPAQAYVARLLALASMQDWYRAALLEPWRETSHDQDVLSQADLIEDLRS